MVGVGPDEGSRRRLPSWMAGLGARKFTNRDERNNCNQEEKISSSSARKSDDRDESNCEQEKKISCEIKRKRTRKSSQRLTSTNKKYNGLGRKKLKEDDDGEGQLTVEDLLSIAKEYVQIDAETTEVQSLNRGFKSEDQLSINELRSSSNAPKSLQKSPTHPTTTSCNLTSEQSRTGDPAQEMLDLFLGPWLKKPPEEEKKNDEGFSYKFTQPSQNDLGKEIVTRMKIKSSLKDKVAMLLD